MNIRNIYSNVIRKTSLITLLKLQVDTMSSEYIEKIVSKLHWALWANNLQNALSILIAKQLDNFYRAARNADAV